MIFEKVREIIAYELGENEEDITLEADFEDDLGADSLDMVEIILAVEEEFGIEISDEDYEKLKTVEGLVECIKEVGK